MSEARSATALPLTGRQFVTTHWSVVLAAKRQDSSKAAEALERLCRTYWYPLYAFVRRRGYSAEDAEDLTQAFFAHLLTKDFLQGIGPQKGRFRTFLLACLSHFLADVWDKRQAACRGGGQRPFSLDALGAEQRYLREPADCLTAEVLYERRWANTLLEHVIDQLRTEAEDAGNERLFEKLQGLLLGEHLKLTYKAVALDLGTTEGGSARCCGKRSPIRWLSQATWMRKFATSGPFWAIDVTVKRFDQLPSSLLAVE